MAIFPLSFFPAKFEDYRFTIGFEFEFLIDPHNTSRDIIQDVINVLHIHKRPGHSEDWRVGQDGSLEPYKQFTTTVEIPSAPFSLFNEDEHVPEDFKIVLDKLNTSPSCSANYSCGVHAHIIINNLERNAPQFTQPFVQAIAKRLSPYPNAWRELDYAQKGDNFNCSHSKYYVVNCIGLKHIEIRAFNGTLRWATFIRYFKQIVKSLKLGIDAHNKFEYGELIRQEAIRVEDNTRRNNLGLARLFDYTGRPR